MRRHYIAIIPFLLVFLVITVNGLTINDGSTTKTAVSEVSLSSGITEFTDVKSDVTVSTSIKIDGTDFTPATSEKMSDQVVWSTATKDVTMSYSYDGKSLKENIVLKSDKILSFPINLSTNSKIIPWYNGQWKVVSKYTGNTIEGIVLEKPYGIDALGNYIEMNYKYDKGVLTLNYNRTVVIYEYPKETTGPFPKEEEIKITYTNITYPLTIDPTWTLVIDHWEAIVGNETIIMWNSTGNSTWTTPAGVSSVQFLIVGGGGAGNGNGAAGNSGSGGNGGSTKNSSSYNVTGGTTYNISVGAGGVGVANAAGGNGTNSWFDTQTITGGWGGHEQQGPSPPAGGDGAGAAHSGQNGGNGNQSNITATLTYYGGGGGSGYTTGGTGGSGGGGRGEDYTAGNAVAGTNGLGGGGGGVSNGGYIPGRNGGSGIVILRYQNPYNITVNFSSDITNIPAGNTATFTDYTNTNGYVMTAWNWSFGDGGTSTVQNATHIYSTVGVYNVTFTMWNNTTGNISKTKYSYITVDFNWTYDSIATGYYTTYFGYKLYKWNTTGNHNWTAPSTATTIDYLIVAGGGGGTCGGGGAGGYLSATTPWNVTNGTIYNVTVGSGGAGGVATVVSGDNGTNSSFHNITAVGGGGGGRQESGPIDGSNYGMPGGSGGGAGASGSMNLSGGSGVTGQGYYGGATSQVGDPYPAGGGGGASQQGGAGTIIGGGYGGNGTYNNITFIGMYYAGGGGGDGSSLGAGVGGPGGIGGGGNGGDNTVGGTAGTNGTGGGGGGAAGGQSGGRGGFGIVIIKYISPLAPVADFTSNTTTAYEGYKVQFNDTSTNTPTSWNWSFNGTGFNTSQNPIYTCPETGFITVNLTATNALGSNTTSKLNYLNCTQRIDKNFEMSMSPSTATIQNGTNRVLTTTIAKLDKNASYIEVKVTWDVSVINISNFRGNTSFFSNTTVNFTPYESEAFEYNPAAGFAYFGVYRTSGEGFIAIPATQRPIVDMDVSYWNYTNGTTIVRHTYGEYYDATNNLPWYVDVYKNATLTLNNTFTLPGVNTLNRTITGCGAIIWNWTDPADASLAHVLVWVNNVYKGEVDPGVQYYNVIGLPYGTYTISTQTKNFFGYINTTWVNNTVTGVIDCPPVSGGASGGVYGDTDILPIVFVIGALLIGLAIYFGGKND